MDMTDKNAGHNGTQWSKTLESQKAALAAEQEKQLNSCIQQLHQHQQRLYDPAALMPAHSSIFGAGVGATLGHPAHPDGIATYASARFHPPPIPTQQSTIDATNLSHTIAHQHSQHQPPHLQHQPSPTHAPATVLTAPAAASPSVPVQSGFVPPPLLPGSAGAVTATATSVLTPNPYAVTQQLDHLTSHLNLQQQLELNKIMNAMNTQVSAVCTAGVGGNNASNLASQQQATRHITTDVPMTSVGTSSSSCGDGTGAVSGAISSTIAENVLNAISATPNSSVSSSVPAVHGRLMGIGVRIPDDERLQHIQEVVETGLSELAKQQIQQIADRIATLKPVEKLLLYLRLPGETPETDPLRHPQNPLGTRSEINHTINWVRSHLEHDPKVSIPKQDVYNDYIAYCDRLDIKPLSTADFGKVMKQVFPGIRPRRLGTRGHSRYCYAAMRKTTKLDAPQLPLLDTVAANESSIISSTSSAGLQNDSGEGIAGKETWEIIRSWAENVLHVKVDSAQELASCIKNTVRGGSGLTATNARTAGGALHKKYTPREPKEKRLMADMGPLKKRRKRKRKGSSSSESSCSQTQAQTQQQSTSAVDEQAVDVKPAITAEVVQIKQEILESPTMQRVQHLPAAAPQLPQMATVTDNFLQQQQQQQMLPMNLVTEQRTVLARAPPSASAFGVVQPQPQTSQQRQPVRTALVGVPSSTTAVKNLTPKIIELGASTSAAGPANAVHEPTAVIKEEEFLDEYNPNIFCKKVRKAQQTKGFWANSPTSVSSNVVVPTITTTAPASEVAASSTSLAAVATSVIATSAMPSSHSSACNQDAGPTPNDVMGPPAQIGSNTSVSPSNSILGADSSGTTPQPPTAASPKVLSRNMLQMRAKRQQIIAALTAEAAANASNNLPDGDASDLPANLGLPRERVISICNMDKHELDDYFVADEVEEEPEDQETELLQYFQTRDAEEKLNSLDAIKSSRHPTASTQVAITTMPATTMSTVVVSTALAKMATLVTKSTPQIAKDVGRQQSAQIVATDGYSYASQLSNGGFTASASNKKHMALGTTATKAANPTTTMAVGSASASLTFMSQKHQQQQHHQQQMHSQARKGATQHTLATSNINNNKRKISLSGPTLNAAEVMATRKNCIFFPISPNSNTGSGGNSGTKNIGNNTNNKFNGSNASLNTANTPNSNSGHGGGGSFFVSPGQSAHRVRPKPTFALGKQLSLDHDSSDPMIGASRRRRSYANLVISGGSNSLIPLTSASAPPSPSVLQQQQQFYGAGFFNDAMNQQQCSNNSAGGTVYNQLNSNTTVNAADILAADQNSLDLDMFSASAGRAMEYDELALDELTTPLNEMQRSQSVPLSQLQRIHSPAFNRSFINAPYSACTSVAQTPVPHEFADSSTLFSENSCSQNSGGASGGMNGRHSAQVVAAKLLDDEAALLATDTAAMLDNLDVAEMFPADFLRMKFPNNVQSNAATTTCSSAGSSSGYSSSACTTFGSAALISGTSGNSLLGSTGNTMSRSVPSTPLPHQQQSPFASYFYGGRRRLEEEVHLSPSLTTPGKTMGGTFTTTVFKYGNNGGGSAEGGGGSVNNNYDMSRSMPTTPTATPRFRYSPTEFTREFLSNGNTNTIDSLISGSANAGSLTDAGAPSEGLSAALTGLTGNNDALIDDSCGLSTDAFVNNTVTDAESMMAESIELLGNL